MFLNHCLLIIHLKTTFILLRLVLLLNHFTIILLLPSWIFLKNRIINIIFIIILYIWFNIICLIIIYLILTYEVINCHMNYVSTYIVYFLINLHILTITDFLIINILLIGLILIILYNLSIDIENSLLNIWNLFVILQLFTKSIRNS